VPEAIGVPYAANHVSERQDDEIDRSVDNSFTRNEPLWRDRHRGMSLINARECNDIVRQFMNFDFNESMIEIEIFEGRDDPKHTSVNMEPADVD